MEGAPKRESAQPKTPHISRRNFMAWGSAATLAAATAPSIYQKWPAAEPTGEVPEVAVETEVAEPAPEEAESLHAVSEKFQSEVEIYRELYGIDRATIILTTKDGHRSEPIPFEDFVVERGTRPNDNGIEEPFLYNLTPVAKDASGAYLVGSIAPEWTDYAKAQYGVEKGIPVEDLEQRHVTAEFVAAMKQEDEPELVAAIESGAVRTKLDILNYFITKDFAGSGGENRVEYIKQNLRFSGNLAKASGVSEALCELMPGLVAVESGYDNDVSSGVDAKGSFQFMPNTWEKELKRAPFVKGEELSFVEQVTAAGELFSKMYDRLQYWCYEEEQYGGRNYLEDIKALFPSQEDFEQYFFVPCLLNAYNTGEQGMGEVIVAFAQSKEFFAHMKEGGFNGYDLFQEMTKWAAASELSQLQDYRSEASTYVQKIYAAAEVLGTTKPVDVAQL